MTANSSDPKNILAFNWITLKVLSDLYGSFPEPLDINSLRFVIRTVVEAKSDSKETEYLSHLNSTIRWLRDEGFIRFTAEDGDTFRNTQLSLRGLTVIGYTPTSLSLTDKKEPLILKIREVLKSGVQEAATDTVKSLVIKALGLMSALATS
jgi:hypothetical protein